jgi:hypothetical protein
VVDTPKDNEKSILFFGLRPPVEEDKEKSQTSSKKEPTLEEEFNFREAFRTHPGFLERLLKTAKNPEIVKALLETETLEELKELCTGRPPSTRGSR